MGNGRSPDRSLRAFEERERWWLDDFGLFRALHASTVVATGATGSPGSGTATRRRLRQRASGSSGRSMPTRASSGSPTSSGSAPGWSRPRSACSVTFRSWSAATARTSGRDECEFDLDSSVGTPPDAFSATGQDWGLPCPMGRCRRQRLRLAPRSDAQIGGVFDGFRIDHLIGFYRLREAIRWHRSVRPCRRGAQRAQGERLLSIFGEGGASLIGEDLGTVPDFLRVSLAERGIPGMKVMRWERNWHAAGHPFHDVTSYPEVSVATSGTHDTETMAEWWDNADLHERQAVLALPTLRDCGLSAEAPFSDSTRDVLLQALFASGSRLLILPLQDVIGWRDRISTPASSTRRTGRGGCRDRWKT